jgi:hypothetical protein
LEVSRLRSWGIEVARMMFRELCKVFARAYDGFRVMRLNELSDSDAHSGSGDEIRDPDDVEDWREFLESEEAKISAKLLNDTMV